MAWSLSPALGAGGIASPSPPPPQPALSHVFEAQETSCPFPPPLLNEGTVVPLGSLSQQEPGSPGGEKAAPHPQRSTPMLPGASGLLWEVSVGSPSLVSQSTGGAVETLS